MSNAARGQPCTCGEALTINGDAGPLTLHVEGCAAVSTSPVKPWEETWTASMTEGARPFVTIAFGRGFGCALRGEAFTMPRYMAEVTTERLYERAQLAAAAPEMARLLLEIAQGSFDCEECYGQCPSCGNREELPPDGRVGIPIKQLGRNQHGSHCEITSVLRKAGALT